MAQTTTASQQITDAVTEWPGITSGYGRRGEFAFRYRQKEIGHLHGDHAAHFFFGEDLFTELFSEGRITHHPVFPDRNGPAARRIESQDDVRDVIELMRRNYDRVAAASAARSQALATNGKDPKGEPPGRG